MHVSHVAAKCMFVFNAMQVLWTMDFIYKHNFLKDTDHTDSFTETLLSTFCFHGDMNNEINPNINNLSYFM